MPRLGSAGGHDNFEQRGERETWEMCSTENLLSTGKEKNSNVSRMR